jgi:hypothetical protein
LKLIRARPCFFEGFESYEARPIAWQDAQTG